MATIKGIRTMTSKQYNEVVLTYPHKEVAVFEAEERLRGCTIVQFYTLISLPTSVIYSPEQQTELKRELLIEIDLNSARFEAFTAVAMNVAIFWDIGSRSPDVTDLSDELITFIFTASGSAHIRS
jgi:hypothetical protein